MPDFPEGPTGKENLDELKIFVGRLYENFDWMLNTLAKNNVLNFDGVTIFDGSVKDPHISDMDGQKLFELSVQNAKVAAGLDGGKMLALSVLDQAIAGMNGLKLSALSTPWGNIANGHMQNEFTITLTPGQYKVDTIITHNPFIVSFPPQIKAKGSSDDYVFAANETAFAYYNYEVTASLIFASQTQFLYAFKNTGASTRTITLQWTRDGITT